MNKVSSGADYVFQKGHISHTDRLLEPVILRYIREFQVKSLLDIGCGNGTMARDLADDCVTIVGMEPSDSGVAQARQNCPKGTFYHLGIYDSPDEIAEKDFDMAMSAEVVEHLFYPRELARFAHKKLKPNGIFLATTPYHGYLKNLAISALGKWDSHHLVSWDGGHIKFWSRATLSALFEEAGFEVIGFHGCGRVAYLWESMVVVGRKKA